MAVPKAVQRQIANGRTLQKVFATPDGKRALFYLMHKAGILDAVHEEVPGLNDYKAGRRSLVLDLMADLRYDYGRLYDLSMQRVAESGEEE